HPRAPDPPPARPPFPFPPALGPCTHPYPHPGEELPRRGRMPAPLLGGVGRGSVHGRRQSCAVRKFAREKIFGPVKHGLLISACPTCKQLQNRIGVRTLRADSRSVETRARTAWSAGT